MQQRILNGAMFALLVLFTSGWLYSAIDAIRTGETFRIVRSIGSAPSPLSPAAAPDAVFALNALAERLASSEEFRGESGEVQVILQQPGEELILPDSSDPHIEVAYVTADGANPRSAGRDTTKIRPTSPGIWNVLLQMGSAVRSVPRLTAITMVPSADLRNGYLGDYRIGNWPNEEGVYAPPRGLVQVTEANRDTPVSRHFVLGDFLTKGQTNVWPKYVVISPRLLDKLELTLQELERQGHPVENVFVVSGFRTPNYNASGGNTQGRGSLSRHMYGDAADIAIDNNHDNCMDDLTGDGRVTVEDARVIVRAAERVEQRYPQLTGGIGTYAPVRGSHCGMVHIDTRGHRARW